MKLAKVLIIGSGGREFAIGLKQKQSPIVGEVIFAPGNAGTAQIGRNVAIKATETQRLIAFAESERPDLTIVGPEDPLFAGVVNSFRERGLVIFGPTRQAAILEESKAWAKNFMVRYGIPTGPFSVFTDSVPAHAYIESQGERAFFIKASGPFQGKGALFSESPKKSHETIDDMLVHHKFGQAGKTILIETPLFGRERSIQALCSKGRTIMFRPLRDYKRADDGDKGNNTGSMGTITDDTMEERMLTAIKDQVVDPTIAGMENEKSPFEGFMFPGLMISPDLVPYVLEFNARGGDSETQVHMELLENDAFELFHGSATNSLGDMEVRFSNDHVVCVNLVSGGYPDSYYPGKEITGIDEASGLPGVTICHAGTRMEYGKLCAFGGRVLNVLGRAATIAEAREIAYTAASLIRWSGARCRHDIGSNLLFPA